MARVLKKVSDFAVEMGFTEPQVRAWIAQGHDNGFEKHKAIVRIGRRVFIDPEAFDRWVDSQNKTRR